METRECVQLHECCIVPYRLSPSGIEFCLTTPFSENRWEFPKTSIVPENSSSELLDRAAGQVGLRGRVDGAALGHFVARRGNESRSMTGYLMLVVDVGETWPREKTHKRLWCLAEECRVRIRRKPLRQFIDLALHAVAARPSPQVNGKGHGHVNGNGHSFAARA